MPGTWKVTTNHRHYSGTASFPMEHIGNRYVLLEKNRLFNSSRCLFKIHHSKEIAKFHLCSHLHRAIYDCNRIRPTPHYQSDNGLCYNSKEFQQFLQCYNITHQTSSPNHPRSNGLVERMVGVAKKLMEKREAMDLRSVWLQSYITVRLHCITIAITDTVHTKGEKPAPTSKHSRCPRNVPNSPGTHEEARDQTRKELHWTQSRYTSLGPAQAECYMGTSNSDKAVCTKLLLDHAGEWHRTAKSIQAH